MGLGFGWVSLGGSFICFGVYFLVLWCNGLVFKVGWLGFAALRCYDNYDCVLLWVMDFGCG